MKFKALLTSACLLFAAQGAFAVVYVEAPDSGDSIGGSQSVVNGTTSISGLGGGGTTGDVDMFGFSWGGGDLTIDSGGSTFDTQLFLFNGDGTGVLGNDDGGALCGGALGLQSCLDLTAGGVLGSLAAGTYYLALSAFNNDPLDAANAGMMSCAGFTTQCVSAAGNLTSWAGTPNPAGTNPYTINFSAAVNEVPNGVPEPGILLLLGLGLAGMAFARRRA